MTMRYAHLAEGIGHDLIESDRSADDHESDGFTARHLGSTN